MDKNSQVYFNSALKLGLPVEEFEAIDGFRMKLGKHHYYFFDKVMPNNNASSAYVSNNKFAVNAILSKANIPVPKASKILTRDFNYEVLVNGIAGLKFPLVVKPTMFSGMGVDVVCNIPNIHSLFTECEKLVPFYPSLLIEEFHGNLLEYRVLIFENKIIELIERTPATVIGNGKSTIEDLVEKANIQRLSLSNILKPIVFDFEADVSLKNQGLTKNSIPAEGECIPLGFTCNSSRGGSVKVVENKMCKENKKLFLKVAKLLNLQLVGLDVKCKSLFEPIIKTKGVIIEANYCPSIRIHEDGISGVKSQVTMTIMKSFIYKHPIGYLMHLMSNKKFLKTLLINLAIVFIVILFASTILLTNINVIK